MRKLVLISLAVFITASLLLTAFAFAEEKTIVIKGKKVKKIEETGAFLGIYMEDLDSKMKKKFDYPKSTGVLITKIVDDSPAEEAGLEKHDVIYSFSGDKVSDAKQLGNLVGSKKPGEKVKVVVYREGKKKTFDLALGEKKTAYVTIDIDDYGDIASKACINSLGAGGNVWVTSDGGQFSVFGNRGRMGVKLHELNEDLAPYFKVGAGEGILVLGVIEDSAAEKAGIKTGDVIVKIGEEEIEELDDVFEALAEALGDDDDEGDDVDTEDEDGTKVSVIVVRMGEKKTFDLLIDDDLALHEEYLIKGPHMTDLKHIEMIHEPQIKAYKLHGMEQEKLETKMKALENEMKKLQEKLRELEKED